MTVRQTHDEPIELTPRDSLRRADALQTMASGSSDLGLQDLIRIFQKHKWTILVWIIVVVTAAVLLSLRMTPIYDAMARVSIQGQTPNYLNFKDNQNNANDSGDATSIDTDVRIMQSDSLAMLVIQKMGLDKNPEFAGRQVETTNGGLPVSAVGGGDRATQQQLISKFHNSLHIQTVAGTTIIEVRFANPNPQLAAQVANSVTQTFIEQNIKARFESTMQAADWLSKQLADLQIKMETSQATLNDYQKEKGIVGLDDKSNLTVDKLEELNKELTSAQADRIQKQSLLKTALTADPASLGATLNDNGLLTLRGQQVELQTTYARLSTELGPSHPRVVEVKNQLDEVQKDFNSAIVSARQRIQNDFEAAQNREALLQSALDDQTGVANQLNQAAIQYKILKQEADSDRELYDGLLEKLKESELAAGLTSSNVRIVDLAMPPVRPASPNIPRNIEFALLFGIIGGVATAFVVEGMNTTVRTPDQSERLSGLPTIGVIPQHILDQAAAREALTRLAKLSAPAGMSPEFLVSFLNPLSDVVEAYRALRTSIMLSASKHPPKIILFTSAMPQDGKTTTSANIALVMAQQNKRVLLVDADLRRPSLHKAFGFKSEIGLSTALSGITKSADAIQPTVQPNLFLMPAGPIPPHPAELLGSQTMEDLMNEWREQFDHIIIDSPPVLSVTDAVMISILADAVILVIRAGKTKSAAVRRASVLLQHTDINLLGIVVNAADLSSPDYYYYGSGYSYYKDYRPKRERLSGEHTTV